MSDTEALLHDFSTWCDEHYAASYRQRHVAEAREFLAWCTANGRRHQPADAERYAFYVGLTRTSEAMHAWSSWMSELDPTRPA